MQKITITFLYLIITVFGVAQRVEILSKSDLKLPAHNNEVAFIEPQTDTAALQFVATFKATGKDSMSNGGDLYLLIKKEAKKVGANCFKLREFSRDSLNKPIILLDSYYANDTIFNMNNSYHEKNVVFVFCDERASDVMFSLKVNNEKRTFKSGTFLKFNLKEGEELKLNKGGFSGTTAKFKYKKDKDAVYLSFSGFGLGGGSMPPPGTIGMSFNTGRMREMQEDYGQLLTLILKQSD